MTATIAEPVVEAEVLTALDFDTPPVEVKSSTVTVMGGSSIVYNMPPGAVLTISAGNVEWTVPDGGFKFEMAKEAPAPLSFDDMMKSYTVWQAKPCGCGLCTPMDTGPMDPTAKALWIEALRDKTRKQGRGALRQGDRWCALGVLIDVAMKAGVQVRHAVDHRGVTVYDGLAGSLPPAVLKWAGLKGDPGVDGVGVAALNDMGTPFREIARRIERCL